MAKRRMISPQIIASDAFLDMPLSSQALYMHLISNADDDGFIGNSKTVMRMVGARDDDMNVLLAKKFILEFETGVKVVKHWLIHNLIRKDRYTETNYLEEKKQLSIKENNSYTWLNYGHKEVGCRDDNQSAPEVRLGKVSLVEVSEVEPIVVEPPKKKSNKIPYQEILDYLNLKTKKNYGNIESNIKYIRSRWKKDHMSLDDFYKCVDNTYAFRMAQDGDLSQMKPSVIFNGQMEARVSGDHYAWFYNKKESPKGRNEPDWLGKVREEF